MNIAVIVNGSAGIQKDEKLSELQEIFKDSSNRVEFFKVREGGKIEDLVQKLLKEGYRTFVAAGGDGTVNAVASQLVDSDAVLGVLPMGTMNNFAKTLNMPLELPEAAKIILVGRTKKVDVGQVNDKIFLNNSSIGIYSRLVREREKHQEDGKHKWHAFLIAALKVFHRYPVLNLRLKTDDKELSRATPIVFVGNNRYKLAKKFELGTRERLDEHVLSVFLTKKINKLQFIKLFFSTIFGTIYREKKFDSFATTEITIESTKQELSVVTDGEVEHMQTPLTYAVKPDALTIIIP